jgi:peptidoglycan/xylan/chitin deacetylase (PgdA/CDA1 family)
MAMSLLRFDRFATLYVAQPLLSTGLGRKDARLSILMYHSVSDANEAGVSPYYRTVTAPDVFKAQMKTMRNAGWRGVSLTEGLRTLSATPERAQKMVAITFDDGFEDFYTAAYPVLRENNFTATMYLPTAYIGDAPAAFKSQRCMTWQQVRELHDQGMEFGSHTVNHPKLWDLDWAAIGSELRDSKKTIEDKLSAEIPAFAYPYAFPQQDKPFTSRFRQELESAGYRSCVTTSIGRVAADDDPYTLKRLPANSCDDADLLMAKLEGGYDWLAWAQKIVKSAKTAVRG